DEIFHQAQQRLVQNKQWPPATPAIDAYTAGALTLDELCARRARLEERLATVPREEQRLTAAGMRREHVETIAATTETFRAALAEGLEQAAFAIRRAIVELLVDRVVVDAPQAEIRYVIPLTGPEGGASGVAPSQTAEGHGG